MIDLAHVEPALEQPHYSRRALLERFACEPVDARVGGSVQEWVNVLTSRLAPTEACTVAEHLFGVLPLVDRFFDRADGLVATLRSGAALGALALFTPTPEHGWGAAVLAGEPAGPGLRVRGELRVASHAADGSIVLVRLGDGDERLAWLDHAAAGVEPRGSGRDRPPRGHAPRRFFVDGALVPHAHVSHGVQLVPAAELYERLERYVAVWALFAVDCARRTVRALRRAARTTRASPSSEPFSASQVVSMDLTELEIEIELAAAAAARHHARQAPHPSGLVLALSAARALAACADRTSRMRDDLGVSPDGPLAEPGTAASIAAHVGSALMLENELARALCLDHTLAR